MSLRRESLRFVLMLGCAATARADVLTVDDDGPAQFTDLPAAVAAAAPGDLLLVQPGTYSGFTLDALPVSIITAMHGDHEHWPWIVGPVVVRNLPAGSTAFLSGLRIDPPPGPVVNVGDAISVDQCAGSVRLNDCLVRGFGQTAYGSPQSWAGLHVEDSHDVVLTACSVTGSWGSLGPVCAVGGAGLHVEDASITAWDSDIVGGYGGGVEYSTDIAANGGPGARLVGGELVLQGGSVNGGAGPFSDMNITAGGAGIEADAQSIVRLRATPVLGGSGGFLWLGLNILQGPDGLPLDVDGTLDHLSGTPTLLAPTEVVVMPGQLVRIQSSGSGLLLAGLQGANAFLPSWSAPLHVADGLLLPVAGFPVSVLLPPLPAGFPGALLHLQLARSTHELSEPGLMALELTLP